MTEGKEKRPIFGGAAGEIKNEARAADERALAKLEREITKLAIEINKYAEKDVPEELEKKMNKLMKVRRAIIEDLE